MWNRHLVISLWSNAANVRVSPWWENGSAASAATGINERLNATLLPISVCTWPMRTCELWMDAILYLNCIDSPHTERVIIHFSFILCETSDIDRMRAKSTCTMSQRYYYLYSVFPRGCWYRYTIDAGPEEMYFAAVWVHGKQVLRSRCHIVVVTEATHIRDCEPIRKMRSTTVIIVTSSCFWCARWETESRCWEDWMRHKNKTSLYNLTASHRRHDFHTTGMWGEAIFDFTRTYETRAAMVVKRAVTRCPNGNKFAKYRASHCPFVRIQWMPKNGSPCRTALIRSVSDRRTDQNSLCGA